MPRQLLLVPTRSERRVLETRLSGWRDVVMAECGFGVIAAAARTVQLVQQHQPQQVWLAGIAGTFSEDVPVGSAVAFRRVACWGIGAGTEEDFLFPSQIGWPQISGTPGEWDREIYEHIELSSGISGSAGDATLLTVCAASSSREHAMMRRRRVAGAVAEDMEGFGVALACQLSDTPVAIVRGMSNRAGDRDRANWQVQVALEAVADMLAGLWGRL